MLHLNAAKELKLMKRIQARDTEALSELYDLYSRLLFGLILSVVKKRTEAEDLLQEVFVQIWEKAPAFDADKGNVYGWVTTLTRHKAIDRIRSRNYKSQVREANELEPARLDGDGFSDPLDATIMAERAELLKKALQEIPEEQRQVIEIAYYNGFTQAELSEHLDIPLGTVKTRMRQGMIKLKNLLQRYIS